MLPSSFLGAPQTCYASVCLRSSQGPVLVELLPDFQFDGPLPTRSIPRGRAYSSVVFDPSTSLIVAASSLQAKFTSFDEDGVRLWEPDGQYFSFISTAKHEVNTRFVGI